MLTLEVFNTQHRKLCLRATHSPEVMLTLWECSTLNNGNKIPGEAFQTWENSWKLSCRKEGEECETFPTCDSPSLAPPPPSGVQYTDSIYSLQSTIELFVFVYDIQHIKCKENLSAACILLHIYNYTYIYLGFSFKKKNWKQFLAPHYFTICCTFPTSTAKGLNNHTHFASKTPCYSKLDSIEQDSVMC